MEGSELADLAYNNFICLFPFVKIKIRVSRQIAYSNVVRGSYDATVIHNCVLSDGSVSTLI